MKNYIDTTDIHEEHPHFTLVEMVGDNTPMGACIRNREGDWVPLDYRVDDDCNHIFYPFNSNTYRRIADAADAVTARWSEDFVSLDDVGDNGWSPISEYKEPENG